MREFLFFFGDQSLCIGILRSILRFACLLYASGENRNDLLRAVRIVFIESFLRGRLESGELVGKSGLVVVGDLCDAADRGIDPFKNVVFR